MAAATVTNELRHSIGNLTGVSCRIAACADTNTWNTGLGTVLWFGITDEDGDASSDVGGTVSSGTITFQVQKTVAVGVFAIGY